MAYYNINVPSGLNWLKAGMPKNHPFYQEHLKTGALRYIHDAIITPRASVLPKWAGDARFMLLRHLFTAPALLGNIISKRIFLDVIGEAMRYGKPGSTFTASRNLPTYVGALIGAFTMLYFAGELEDYIRYGSKGNPKYQDPARKAQRVADRMGLAGRPGQIVHDIWMSSEYGRVPVESFLGADISNLMSLLDAMVGTVHTGRPRGTIREAMNFIPGITAVPQKYKRQFLDEAEALVVDHIGGNYGEFSSSVFGGTMSSHMKYIR